jgi:primosomal protein N' (replication factor Y)
MTIFQVEVALSQVERPLTYLVPPLFLPLIQPLSRVMVPLRRRQALGFALSRPYPAPAPEGLKALSDALDSSAGLPPSMLNFFVAAASYYQVPLGRFLDQALPAGLGRPDPGTGWPQAPGQPLVSRLAAQPRPEGLKEQAVRLLDILEEHGSLLLSSLQKLFPRAAYWLPRLEKAGLVRITMTSASAAPVSRYIITPEARPLTLSPEQEEALRTLAPALQEGRFQSFLLHGVTGSGKTEVYLRACEMALAEGRTALILVPEIGLCLRLQALMQARFGSEQVAVLHSGLTPAQRRQQWAQLAGGRARLALGARSAVFAPLDAPGVICVDEEQDEAYKQEDRLRYNARDLALLRGKEQGCPVLLGSATPAVTTWHQAGRGRHTVLSLRQRIHNTPLPRMELTDLRSVPHLEGGFMSPRLYQALRDNKEAGKQALLFLNRRGFAPAILCPQCGEKFVCPACSLSFTWHQNRKRLICHLCGRMRPLPAHCPHCQAPAEKFRTLGLGTEAVEEKLRQMEPDWRLARLDRDTAANAGQLGKILQRMINHEIDILIGTQMLSKGHHFPELALVGVLMADQGLNQPDFRAAERAYILLTQVAGRAGRQRQQGLVLIQSYNPHHHALRAAAEHDEKGFYEQELQERLALAYPPFGRLISLRLDSRQEEKARSLALQLQNCLRAAARKLKFMAQVLGPAPAPVIKVNNYFRYYLLIKAANAGQAAGILRLGLYNMGAMPKNARLSIDIDPLQFA